MRQLSSGGHFVDGELLALRHDLSNSELTLPDESRPPFRTRTTQFFVSDSKPGEKSTQMSQIEEIAEILDSSNTDSRFTF